MLSRQESQIIRGYYYSAVVWLLVPGLAGLLMATLLYNPSAQQLVPHLLQGLLNFGRLRSMHVNVLIFGWLSLVYAGSMLYITRRLTDAPLFSLRLAQITLWLWHLLLVAASVTLLLGMNQGREYAEMIWPLDVLFLVILILLGLNIWGTVFRRREDWLQIG